MGYNIDSWLMGSKTSAVFLKKILPNWRLQTHDRSVRLSDIRNVCRDKSSTNNVLSVLTCAHALIQNVHILTLALVTFERGSLMHIQ